MRSFASAVLGSTLLSALIGVGNAAPLELARGAAPEHPQQPQVAIGPNDVVHIVYGIGDTILYRRSDDRGRSFAPPVRLPAVHAMSLGMRRGPRIAVTPTAICVTAVGGKQGKGRDGDVLAVRSLDGGRTWSEATAVNDVADSAREGLHAMAASPRGDLCCVWLDLRNRRTEIMASMSADGGATWSKNALVYRSPSGNVCECCHPSVVYDARGMLHVMWRNSVDGARDMYVASASDGRTFSAATKLGSGSWPLKACPMDGGALAAVGPGMVATAWRREKSVYLATSGQAEEQLLGTGEQPWIAATDHGAWIVWLEKRGGPLFLKAPTGDARRQLDSSARDPVIATSRSGLVVAAWEASQEGQSTIQLEVVANGSGQ